MGVRNGAGVARDRPAARTLRLLRRRRVARAEGELHDDRPGERGAARGGRAGDRAGDRGCSLGCTRGLRERLVCAAGLRARKVPVPDRAHPPGTLARVRGTGVVERRQADPRVPRRGPAPLGRALFLLRGLGRQARVRVPEPKAGSARRRRSDHPVELPAPDAGLEDRARAGRGEHGRAEAGRDDASLGAALLRRPPPGGAATRGREHRHGRRPGRSGSGQSRGRQGRVHGLDRAVEGIINGIYFNQGHVCCAGSRLLVQESIYEPVISKLKRRLQTLRVGDPLDKNTDVGAINSRPQLDKIEELVRSGEEEGAEIYQPPCRLPEKGYWFVPTVFTNVAQSYRIAQEEIFGPVLSVLTFRTPDEAVEKANNTLYGLSAGVWTEKGSRILSMAQRLRAGVIWANTYNRFDPSSPFGGYKESGFGREGGLHGLEPYLRFDE